MAIESREKLKSHLLNETSNKKLNMDDNIVFQQSNLSSEHSSSIP